MTREERTFHWEDWDLDALLEHKARTGLTTSLVVPARNEAATVGAVVSRVREALMDTAQLLDEIVVIDSDSTDETHSVASAAGAVVHRSREIRPDLGTHAGKGEAMWKSLFVTRGDLLVFMDADLMDWDTHFVRGLLGPLLTTDAALVKGFYERPSPHGAGAEAGDETALEGGRVTELVARPLIALDWPDLGWLVQPLAGEWAIRRDLFERLHVPVGYAVELAALIDTMHLLGTDAIAQVDLGRRAHRSQALRDLGAMAVQIIAASEKRSDGPGSLRRSRTDNPGSLRRSRSDRLEGPDAPDEVLLHQHRKQGAGVHTVTREIDLLERPPATHFL